MLAVLASATLVRAELVVNGELVAAPGIVGDSHTQDDGLEVVLHIRNNGSTVARIPTAELDVQVTRGVDLISVKIGLPRKFATDGTFIPLPVSALNIVELRHDESAILRFTIRDLDRITIPIHVALAFDTDAASRYGIVCERVKCEIPAIADSELFRQIELQNSRRRSKGGN